MQIALMAFDGVMRVLFYTLIGASVYRLFTISKDLSEIREILRDFKRGSDVVSLAAAVAERRQTVPASGPGPTHSFYTGRTTAETGIEPTGISVNNPADL